VIDVFDYGQVCETNDSFGKHVQPPEDLTRLPFRVDKDWSVEELIQFVDFIWSAPDVPARAILNSSRRAKVDLSLDTSLPIYSIRSRRNQASVMMGMIGAGESYSTKDYTCEKTQGTWRIIKYDRAIY